MSQISTLQILVQRVRNFQPSQNATLESHEIDAVGYNLVTVGYNFSSVIHGIIDVWLNR